MAIAIESFNSDWKPVPPCACTGRSGLHGLGEGMDPYTAGLNATNKLFDLLTGGAKAAANTFEAGQKSRVAARQAAGMQTGLIVGGTLLALGLVAVVLMGGKKS